MRIKTILVLTDFSENSLRAFERAHDVAMQVGAKLYVLHIQNESTLRTAVKEGLLRADSTDEKLQAAVAELNERRFIEMSQCAQGSPVVVEHVSKRGDTESQVVEYAREIQADLIVVGRHGASVAEKIKSAVLGSVAASVIAKSPCPVLVVRRDHK